MKKPRNKFPSDGLFVVIGFLVLCILGIGIYFVARFVVNVINGMDEEIAGLVFVLFSTILVSASALWVQRAAHQRRLRVERARAYARFLDTWSNSLSEGQAEDPQQVKQSEKDLRAAERHLLLCASSKVLERYMDLRQEIVETGLGEPVASELIEEIVAAMRKDLSRSKLRLGEGDIADLLLNRSNLAQQTTRSAGFTSGHPS